MGNVTLINPYMSKQLANRQDLSSAVTFAGLQGYLPESAKADTSSKLQTGVYILVGQHVCRRASKAYCQSINAPSCLQR